MKPLICFIALRNLSGTPYLEKYLNLLEKPYDIINWNRDGVKEECGALNHYVYDYPISRTSKLDKLKGYSGFKKYATKILKNNNYNKVILLSGNLAVLLNSILLKKYSGRYIIDIRDYYLEDNIIYYHIEKKLIEQSGLAVISSEAYKTFLPNHEYLIAHNSPLFEQNRLEQIRNSNYHNQKVKRKQIVLSYIGGVRFLEQDKKVLSYFANDDRFLVRYIGSGANLLETYCKEKRIENIYLHDRFLPEETLDFFETTDIILNLYGNGTPLLDYALSNKLYYAALLYKPILVCPNTYMEEISVNYRFGFSINLSNNEKKDELYKWYKKLNYDELKEGCNLFIKKTEVEELIFKKGVLHWFDE